MIPTEHLTTRTGSIGAAQRMGKLRSIGIGSPPERCPESVRFGKPPWSKRKARCAARETDRPVHQGFVRGGSGGQRQTSEVCAVISAVQLKTRSVKDLATMARKKKVLGWHTMRKEQLVRAILRKTKVLAGKRNGAAGGREHGVNGHSPGGARRNGSAGQAGKTAAPQNGAGKEGPHSAPPAPPARDQDQAGRGQGPFVPGRRASGDAAGPAGGDGPRPVLAARLLGTETGGASSGPRRRWGSTGTPPGPSCGPRAQPQRHHQRRPAGRPRHRDPRRREQLVHRRAESAQELPARDRLPGPGRVASTAWPAATSSPRPPAGTAERFDRNWAEVAKDFDRIYAMTAGSSEQEANGDLKDVSRSSCTARWGTGLGRRSGPRRAAVRSGTSSSRSTPS